MPRRIETALEVPALDARIRFVSFVAAFVASGACRLGLIGEYRVHVLSALEGGWIRAVLLAHAAPQLTD